MMERENNCYICWIMNKPHHTKNSSIAEPQFKKKNSTITYFVTCWFQRRYSPSSLDTNISAASIVSFSLSSLIFSSAASLVRVSNLVLREATLRSTSPTAWLNLDRRPSAFSRFLYVRKYIANKHEWVDYVLKGFTIWLTNRETWGYIIVCLQHFLVCNSVTDLNIVCVLSFWI